MGNDWPTTDTENGAEKDVSKPEQFKKVDEALQALKRETEFFVGQNGGKINPDSVRANPQGFIQQFKKMSENAKTAMNVLEEENGKNGNYCGAIGPFIANNGLGWIANIGKQLQQYEGKRRLDDEKEATKMTEDLQRFVDISKKLNTELFQSDELVRFFEYKYEGAVEN